MEHAGQLIDAVQTAGIVVISSAMIYVIWRLEKQFSVWAGTLGQVNNRLREQSVVIEKQEAVLDSLNKLWTRITQLEERVGVRDADFVPTPVLRKALKRIETLEREVRHEGAPSIKPADR